MGLVQPVLFGLALTAIGSVLQWQGAITILFFCYICSIFWPGRMLWVFSEWTSGLVPTGSVMFVFSIWKFDWRSPLLKFLFLTLQKSPELHFHFIYSMRLKWKVKGMNTALLGLSVHCRWFGCALSHSNPAQCSVGGAPGVLPHSLLTLLLHHDEEET